MDMLNLLVVDDEMVILHGIVKIDKGRQDAVRPRRERSGCL